MSKLVEFSTQKRFQIRACVVSARKAKHLDVTTMFSYSHANTPLGQSERVYYLSYFIKRLIGVYVCVCVCVCVCRWERLISGSLIKVYRWTKHTHKHASKHWDYKQVKSYEFHTEGYETGHQYQKVVRKNPC